MGTADRREYYRSRYKRHRFAAIAYGKRYRETHRAALIVGKRRWRLENPDMVRAYRQRRRTGPKAEADRETRRRWLRMHHQSLRGRFLDMYGRKCSCCPETDDRFLTNDHVKGIGRGRAGGKSRRGIGGSTAEYAEAIREYRPDLYRVMCYNCNLGRAKNGGVCPHMDPRPPPLRQGPPVRVRHGASAKSGKGNRDRHR